MTNNKEKDPLKGRSLRVEDSVWKEFLKYKPRDKSWNLFIKELVDFINYPNRYWK